MIERKHVAILRERLSEPRFSIIALTGPRQVGKSTIVRQALEGVQVPVVHESADGTSPHSYAWIETVWERARRLASGTPVVLVIDEIQKVPQWSETVKKLWDEDTMVGVDVRVVILGSSMAVLHDGLSESLAGRFERIRVMPWTYTEMKQAFGWDLESYLRCGGYPGPAHLVHNEERWLEYIRDAVIEPVLSRDLLQLHRIHKPFLLRQLAELGSRMSGCIVAYSKLLGQLHDAGNVTTLAHYLVLLEESGMLTGLSKFTTQPIRQRGSSPKLQVFANAIATAFGASWMSSVDPGTARGQLVESAIGAHLRCGVEGSQLSLHWWREGNNEVDFVLTKNEQVLAIEVASGATHHLRGLDAFKRRYPHARLLLVGAHGMPIEEFLTMNVRELL